MTVTDQNQNEAQSQTDAAATDAPAADPQAELAKLQAEKRDLNDRMLRVAADFENYKRRIRREMDEAGTRAMEGLLKELLPVLDNLDRAVDAGTAAQAAQATTSQDKPGGASNALLDGVRLVQKQFLSALEKSQVKTFESLGKPFDPQVHEAVQQVDSDTLQPGTVATVFARGYTAGARLLRPAMVAVVRSKPQAAGGGSTDGEEAHQGDLN